MTYAGTFTFSSTNTFTEARAKAVMGKVLADFMILANAGHKDMKTLMTWHEEISFAVLRNAVEKFQLKVELPTSERIALDYAVSDDGSLTEDTDAGGIDFWALPQGTKVNVVLRYRSECPRLAEVKEFLRGRGWTDTGTFVEGDARRDRAYSKDSFGLVRSQIGTWP